MQLMTGESLFGAEVGSSLSRDDVGFVTYHLAHGKVWMFLSAACILVLAFWFMILAALKVDPMNTASVNPRAGKKRDKKKG